MCIQVWDCDCHLEDRPDDDGGSYVPVTRFGSRPQTRAWYRVYPTCPQCGVHGHPCKCEEDNG